MSRLILFFLCLLPPLLATAQTQPDCDKMLRDGDALMTRKDPPLEEALRCYLNALNCNSQLAGVIGPKLQGVFDAIKKQKESEQRRPERQGRRKKKPTPRQPRLSALPAARMRMTWLIKAPLPCGMGIVTQPFASPSSPTDMWRQTTPRWYRRS
jgi:hypothetical protein